MKLGFNIHTYAPELNEVFYNHVNINKMFTRDFLRSLTKNYRTNAQAVRKELKKNCNIIKKYAIIEPFHSIKDFNDCKTITKGYYQNIKEVINAKNEIINIMTGEKQLFNINTKKYDTVINNVTVKIKLTCK